jgi:Tfp pilus assembly protein PilF
MRQRASTEASSPRWPDRYEVYFDLANMLGLHRQSGSEAIKRSTTDTEKRIGLSEELIMQAVRHAEPRAASAMTEATGLALNVAIKAFPEDPRYMGLLAEVFDQQGEHDDKALEQYRKTLAAGPWQ